MARWARNAPASAGRQPLSGSQRALLVGGLLVNVGTFAVYPYLAVLLRDRLDADMAQVGLVLGAATLVQFASAPLTAALAERVGLRRALSLATWLYLLGALTYLTGAGSPALTVLALFLSCAAGALYSPAFRGYLVHAAPPGRRPRLVSAGNAAGTLGIALGPVVGALFLDQPGRLFAGTTVLYALLAAGHLLLRPEPRPTEPEQPPTTPSLDRPGRNGRRAGPLRRALRGVAGRPFAVTVLTHYLYLQFYQYLSVYAEGRLAAAALGAVMMGYALGLAVVQPLAAGWIGRLRYPAALAVGFPCMAVGMAAFATGRPAGIAAGAVAMSVGNAVLFLKNDLEALAAGRRSPTVVFGHQRLAVGLGALLSGAVGGRLYATLERADALPAFWLLAAAQCLLLPPLLLALAGRPRRGAPTEPAPPATGPADTLSGRARTGGSPAGSRRPRRGSRPGR